MDTEAASAKVMLSLQIDGPFTLGLYTPCAECDATSNQEHLAKWFKNKRLTPRNLKGLAMQKL